MGEEVQAESDFFDQSENIYSDDLFSGEFGGEEFDEFDNENVNQKNLESRKELLRIFFVFLNTVFQF